MTHPDSQLGNGLHERMPYCTNCRTALSWRSGDWGMGYVWRADCPVCGHGFLTVD